ncbi:MAG: GNAT family N-acetyltransferase [Chromatiaceae bacterium]
MIDAPLRVVSLAAAHDRTAFDSGSEPLDRYFRLQVSQDIRRRVTVCFVALTPEQRIAGYYTLASASLLLADALDRAARAEIAAYALVIEAKDDPAAAFYRRHGFTALPDSPMTLFLPLATVNKAQ